MNDAIYLIKGAVRKQIMRKLGSPKTPKILAKELNKHIQSISRTLQDLERHKLVECVNPEDDRYRYYKITTKGNAVLREMDALENYTSK